MMPLEIAVDPDLARTSPEHVDRPTMVQTWTDLSFVHWPMDPARVQALLPESLTVDVFEDRAWLGLIPFHLSVRKPPRMPAIPVLSTTAEVNVRTYVRGPDGRRGVWFLSLDAAHIVPVVVARVWYRLPYRCARVSIRRRPHEVRYEATRRTIRRPKPAMALRLEIREERLALTPLEQFLTCRWRLYSPTRSGIMVTQVDHEPWPIWDATPINVVCGLFEPLGLGTLGSTPHALFSPGVTVRFGPRRRATGIERKMEKLSARL